MGCEFEEIKNIETFNYRLMEIKIEDYEDIYHIYSDEETLKYQCPVPIKSLDEAKEYTQKIIEKSKNDKNFIRWVIRRKGEKKVLGVCSMHKEGKKVEIGYMLNRLYWRQNIMTEVLGVIIDFVAKNLKSNTIEAKIHPENIASIKLCEKLGFDKVEVKKNYVINKRTNKYEDRVIYKLNLG